MLSAALTLVACGDSPTDDGGACGTVGLPLRGNANAPVVNDVGLEVQTSGIVVVATATDPQGGANLRDVQQTIRVFSNTLCAGDVFEVRDDLVDSGVEETFGTAVNATTQRDVYDAIAAATTSWPVELEFSDRDGNRTVGRVRARIIR